MSNLATEMLQPAEVRAVLHGLVTWTALFSAYMSHDPWTVSSSQEWAAVNAVVGGAALVCAGVVLLCGLDTNLMAVHLGTLFAWSAQPPAATEPASIHLSQLCQVSTMLLCQVAVPDYGSLCDSSTFCAGRPCLGPWLFWPSLSAPSTSSRRNTVRTPLSLPSSQPIVFSSVLLLLHLTPHCLLSIHASFYAQKLTNCVSGAPGQACMFAGGKAADVVAQLRFCSTALVATLVVSPLFALRFDRFEGWCWS